MNKSDKPKMSFIAPKHTGYIETQNEIEFIKKLSEENRLAFDSLAKAMSQQLAPVVAKSVKDIEKSFAEASRTLAVKK